MTTNPEPTYLLIRKTDYTYDDYEELVSAHTTYVYDAAGRLIEKISIEYNLDERTEEETPISDFRKEYYERDAAGNAVKRLVYDRGAVISERDIETLRCCGLCYADRMTVNGATLPRHPMPVLASGRLMHALNPFLKGRERSEFLPLLTAAHVLVQAADTTTNNAGGV